jgi:hypothetical protein
MSESIEAPKRKYTRKPKIVALSDVLSIDSDVSTTSTDSGLTPPPEVPQKPKKQYKKKVAISEPVEPVDEISPPVLERQTNAITEESPPSSPQPVKEKKPRTDKQKQAFEKMRLARIAKQEELKKLKEIEKEQKQLEREQTKLNNITEKVVEKVTAIKQRKTKKTTENFDDLPQEPQYVPQIQEKKNREILFV